MKNQTESITMYDLKVGQRFYFRYGKYGKRVDVQPDESRVYVYLGRSEQGADLVRARGQVVTCVTAYAPVVVAI